MNRLGDYKLRRRLAVGGMGEVYLGEKIGPEGFVKPVVLKCVLPQLAKDPAFVELFLDEARVAALLNHPNIAQVYDFGEADGIYYMAMEYVPGYTLDDIRRKHAKIEQQMPIEHIACVASQACQGLEYAHSLCDGRGISLGLVHRDVSPHNVMVSVDGGVKIVDFGIAKARRGLSRVEAKGAVGKFGYMSPEQARGESVDGRTDVFSLGVCIWELVTNERLHAAKIDRPPDYDALQSIRSALTVRDNMPKHFDRLLGRALAISKADRFSGCHQMHLELEKMMAAMTHYAGHAALAEYINELVEGKYDSKDEREDSVRSEQLDGVQKYEEVFGTQSLGLTALPSIPPIDIASSLDTTGNQEVGSYGVQGSTQDSPVEKPRRSHPMHEGLALELDIPSTPQRSQVPVPASPTSASMPTRVYEHRSSTPKRGSKQNIFLILLLLLAGLGGFAWHKRVDIAQRWDALMGTAPTIDLGTRFRLTTSPPGADVFVDGDRRGVTPVIVAFLPDFSHYLEIRKTGYATERRRFSVSVARGVRDMRIALGPGGNIDIQSRPSGGKVFLNGLEIPKLRTPVRLLAVPAERELKLTVEKAGIPPVTLKVKVTKNATKKLFFNLRGQ